MFPLELSTCTVTFSCETVGLESLGLGEICSSKKFPGAVAAAGTSKSKPKLFLRRVRGTESSSQHCLLTFTNCFSHNLFSVEVKKVMRGEEVAPWLDMASRDGEIEEIDSDIYSFSFCWVTVITWGPM